MADTLAAPIPTIQNQHRAAFDRMRPLIAAITTEQLVPITIDVRSTISIALGTASFLPQMRAQIDGLAAYVDVPRLFQLEDCANALIFANADHLFATTPPEALPALHEEGSKLKELLLSAANTLSVYGLLPNDRVTQIKNPNGYKDLAEFLSALAVLFEDHWEAVSSKTPVTVEQINRASELSGLLAVGAGMKARAPLNVSEATLTRQRAFTLLVRTYEEVRHVIAFLRRKEGDVDQLAPSLYAGRGNAGGRRKDEGEADDAPPPVGGEVVAPVNGNGTPSHVPVGHPSLPEPLQSRNSKPAPCPTHTFTWAPPFP